MHFIAVSVAPAQNARLVELYARAQLLVTGAYPTFSSQTPSAFLTAALAAVESGGVTVVARQPMQICAHDYALTTLAEVAVQWADGQIPDAYSFTPPFALAGFDQKTEMITIVADFVGLSHIYCYTSDGIAAVSSSALALAQLLGVEPNPQALLGMALTGSMIGTDTPFTGIEKLSSGCSATIRDGKLNKTVAVAPISTESHPSDPETGAAILQTIVRGLAKAFPDAQFELSGGLDSRLLLAALPNRAQHQAFTIAAAGSDDGVVATDLAKIGQMSHQLVDADTVLGQSDFAATLREASIGHEFSANPLDRALITILNRLIRVSARFSGQNGETLRGFYYAGQRLEEEATSARADWLVNWRLITNDAVDPNLFDGEFYRTTRASVAARLRQLILGLEGTDWAGKLDNLYLVERMQHWCGIGISNIQHHRQILMPFFDRRFIDFARSASPKHKSGSWLAGQILVALDADLAQIALDNGRIPAELGCTGWRPKLSAARAALKKIRRKIAQRLRRSPAATVSAVGATALFWARGGQKLIDIAPLYAWGMFNPKRLSDFASGQWRPDRPTLGFLINCSLMAAELARAKSAEIDSGHAIEAAMIHTSPLHTATRQP